MKTDFVVLVGNERRLHKCLELNYEKLATNVTKTTSYNHDLIVFP